MTDLKNELAVPALEEQLPSRWPPDGQTAEDEWPRAESEVLRSLLAFQANQIDAIELPPFLPKGSPVELTYRYDANQVLEVTVDAFGKQNRVSIARNVGLSESEIATATADLSQVKIL